MRTYLCSILLLCAFVSTAQNTVVFQSYFKPNKTYTTTVVNSSTSELDFAGNDEKIAKIKEGTKLPVLVTGVSDLVLTATTGAAGKNQLIPVQLIYDKAETRQSMNGKESQKKDIINGLIIRGKYDRESKLTIDTLISDKLDQNSRLALKSTLETIQQQVKFPATPMKIGDTFDQIVPMIIPLPGTQPIKIVISTTYTLNRIQNNHAMFDIVQNATLDMAVAQANLKASGAGKGTAEFDIQQNMISSLDTDLLLDMSMTIEDLTMSAKINSKLKQTMTIR